MKKIGGHHFGNYSYHQSNREKILNVSSRRSNIAHNQPVLTSSNNNNNLAGLGAFIQLIILAIGALIYFLFKSVKSVKVNYKNKTYTWRGVYEK